MDTRKFEEFYNKLNPEQKEAVASIEGPTMVIAGPGTGKTHILALRVANILLKTHLSPGNILALTFTEGGASEIRRRLYDIVGPTAYYVNISTFHGFCNEIIQSYPEEFMDILGRKPADEVDRLNLMKAAILESGVKLLAPFGEPMFYLKDSIKAVSQLKREAIGPDEFMEILRKEEESFGAIPDAYYDKGRNAGKMKGRYADIRKQLDKNLELLKIYRSYQDNLAKSKLYDYDDMILKVAETLGGDSGLLTQLQEKFQYILVDEHQDTNNAQNKILELLCNFYEVPNLFVVGDEKQAIFRFQGASLQNFLYFKNLYPGAKLITLKKNYRSPQSILDLACGLIKHNAAKISDIIPGIDDSLLSAGEELAETAVSYEFKTVEAEAYFLSQKISALLKEGEPPQEIAVIYRDNRDANLVAEFLSRLGAPFKIESQKNILEDRDIRKLVSVFRFLDDFSSDEKLFELLHADFLDIPVMEIYKLQESAKKSPLLEVLSRNEKLKAVSDLLLRLRKTSQNASLLELFEEATRDSGFLKYIIAQKDGAARLARLNAFFGEIKNLVENDKNFDLHDLVDYLDTLKEHDVIIKEKNRDSARAAVRLMTAHGAKGLEFDYVFIVNVFDGHWGHRRTRELIKLPSIIAKTAGAFGANEGDDERRLFYVALTRARKAVCISYATQNMAGREQFASQFLSEVEPKCLKSGRAEEYERDFERNRQIIFFPRISQNNPVLDKDYLNNLFKKRGLSATALNNFIRCPWKYFYVNLLRVPKAPSRHQIYGKAVHAALKDFFDLSRKNRNAASEFLLSRFEHHLKDEPLTERDFKEALAKGQKSLGDYYGHYRNSWCLNTQNEFRVNKVFLPLAGDGEVKLTGSLDKIEYGDGVDGVNVVDYKTGKPKSRNEIEGKTKNADGDYLRQLTFYKLLLNEFPQFGMEMASGELDFIEADKGGVFHKEKFFIDGQKVSELRELVRCVADKIVNLSFLNDRCEDKECEFCGLRFCND